VRCWLFGHDWYQTYAVPSKYEIRACERCPRREWFDGGAWVLMTETLEVFMRGWPNAETRRDAERRLQAPREGDKL